MKWILLLALLGTAPGLADAFRPYDPSHTLWTEWLRGFVPDGKRVDYPRAKVDQKQMRDYLAGLSAVSPRVYSHWSAPRRLAFLLNAYNAFSVRLAVDNYPLKSLKDLSSPLRSIWKKEFFQLFGESESLDGIEEGMLRKQFKDPRIHFAIHCSARGGPALGKSAWTEEGLEEALERAARGFVTDPTKNRYDAAHNRLELSPLFEWYEADFKGRYGTVAKFVAGYLASSDEERAKIAGAKVVYGGFDWSLNDRGAPGSGG